MLFMLLAALESDQDRERFMRLFNELENRLFYIAKSLVKETTLAEEAVQETWVRTIRYFERISATPWEEAKRYVITIVKNVSKNILRRESRLVPMPDDWDEPAPAEETDGFHRLVELIRGMPEHYREILELKFVLEWSNKDIAKTLGIGESTVASRIQRGRAKLMETLRREGYLDD